jgi:hypothetical protein
LAVCDHRLMGEQKRTEAGEERVGAGLGELDISDWTCFACGERLTQAHEGDYFHTDPNPACIAAVPVPTSLVRAASGAADASS